MIHQETKPHVSQEVLSQISAEIKKKRDEFHGELLLYASNEVKKIFLKIASFPNWLESLGDFSELSKERQKAYDLLILGKDSGYLFGSGGIFYKEEEGIWELGYNLMHSHWNQGYATEAAKAMLDFGIGELNIKEFVAFHAVDNPASGAVMRKCGFKYEGNEIHTKFDGVTKFESKRHRLIVE